MNGNFDLGSRQQTMSTGNFVPPFQGVDIHIEATCDAVERVAALYFVSHSLVRFTGRRCCNFHKLAFGPLWFSVVDLAYEMRAAAASSIG